MGEEGDEESQHREGLPLRLLAKGISLSSRRHDLRVSCPHLTNPAPDCTCYKHTYCTKHFASLSTTKVSNHPCGRQAPSFLASLGKHWSKTKSSNIVERRNKVEVSRKDKTFHFSMEGAVTPLFPEGTDYERGNFRLTQERSYRKSK